MSLLPPADLERALDVLLEPWSWLIADIASVLDRLGVRAISPVSDELFLVERDGFEGPAGVVQSVESGGRVFAVTITLGHAGPTTDPAALESAAAEASAAMTARLGKPGRGRTPAWLRLGLRLEVAADAELATLRFRHVAHREAFDTGT